MHLSQGRLFDGCACAQVALELGHRHHAVATGAGHALLAAVVGAHISARSGAVATEACAVLQPYVAAAGRRHGSRRRRCAGSRARIHRRRARRARSLVLSICRISFLLSSQRSIAHWPRGNADSGASQRRGSVQMADTEPNTTQYQAKKGKEGAGCGAWRWTGSAAIAMVIGQCYWLRPVAVPPPRLSPARRRNCTLLELT
jgi:hypothetical protein